MLIDFDNAEIKKYGNKAEFGLERESLRVRSDGTLADTPHPFPGDKQIDRDFCENQIEIITDVFTDAASLISQLNDIHDRIDKKLMQMNELLWCFSNPPVIGREEDIPVAVFGEELRCKNEYRAYLAEKYGKKKMLFSGIHFNYSFSPEFIDAAFALSGEKDRRMFSDRMYLSLTAKLVSYSWLAVFLTAASPVMHSSFGIESNRFSSVRCSKYGYWNDFVPMLDYSSLEAYVQSIERLVSGGRLRSVTELYYPVRIKPRGDNSLEALREKGINHIELRVTDVNPLSRTGIFREDIEFFHLLMLYLLSLPEQETDRASQLEAIENVKQAAVFGDKNIYRKAESVLSDIAAFAEKYYPGFMRTVKYQQSKLLPGRSYAELVSKYFSGDYIGRGLQLAGAYRRREKQCVNCSVFLPQRNIIQTNI